MRGEFGRVLRRERFQAGREMPEVAEAAMCSARMLYAVEDAHASPPDPETVRRIAEFLGVPVHVLEEPARLSREAWSKGEK